MIGMVEKFLFFLKKNIRLSKLNLPDELYLLNCN